MSDFLTRIINKSAAVRPRLPSRFEPVSAPFDAGSVTAWGGAPALEPVERPTAPRRSADTRMPGSPRWDADISGPEPELAAAPSPQSAGPAPSRVAPIAGTHFPAAEKPLADSGLPATETRPGGEPAQSGLAQPSPPPSPMVGVVEPRAKRSTIQPDDDPARERPATAADPSPGPTVQPPDRIKHEQRPVRAAPAPVRPIEVRSRSRDGSDQGGEPAGAARVAPHDPVDETPDRDRRPDKARAPVVHAPRETRPSEPNAGDAFAQSPDLPVRPPRADRLERPHRAEDLGPETGNASRERQARRAAADVPNRPPEAASKPSHQGPALRPLLPARAPRPEARAATAETTVHISIGRIEVRAVTAPAAKAPAAKPTAKVMTLDAYLRGKDGGRQ